MEPGPAAYGIIADMGHNSEADARTSVLVIEDDATIGAHLEAGLRRHDYDAVWERSGAGGLTTATTEHPDVVLLDLGLPDLDGVEVARQLRAMDAGLLIIILTARSAEIDVIVGLDAGADDYLVKPFTLSVLLARLRAHLRRHRNPEETQPIVIGTLTLDTAARRCIIAGRELALRPKEFDLLATLAGHVGAAVSREDLMLKVWDERWFGSTKTLDVTIATLRRRLDEAGSATGTLTITTLRGFGYRLEP